MVRMLSYLLSGFLIAYLLWGLQGSKQEFGLEAVGTEPSEVVAPGPGLEPDNRPANSASDSQPIFVESPREAAGYKPQSIGEDIDFDDVSVFDGAPVQSLGEDIDVEDLSIFDNAPQVDFGDDIDVEDFDLSEYEIVQDVGEDIDLEDYFEMGNDQPEESIGEDVDPDTP